MTNSFKFNLAQDIVSFPKGRTYVKFDIFIQLFFFIEWLTLQHDVVVGQL